MVCKLYRNKTVKIFWVNKKHTAEGKGKNQKYISENYVLATLKNRRQVSKLLYS